MGSARYWRFPYHFHHPRDSAIQSQRNLFHICGLEVRNTQRFPAFSVALQRFGMIFERRELAGPLTCLRTYDLDCYNIVKNCTKWD